MKKIIFGLNLVIIGTVESGKDLLTDYLKKSAIEYNVKEKFKSLLIIYQEIPIKIRLYNVKNFKELIELYDVIEKIDVLIITINIYNLNSFNEVDINKFHEFHNYDFFQGIDLLVGIDKQPLKNKSEINESRIKRIELIQKTKDLEILYCFEIQNKERDINEIFNTVFDNFIIKLYNRNLEQIEHAKSYGKDLIRRSNI